MMIYIRMLKLMPRCTAGAADSHPANLGARDSHPWSPFRIAWLDSHQHAEAVWTWLESPICSKRRDLIAELSGWVDASNWWDQSSHKKMGPPQRVWPWFWPKADTACPKSDHPHAVMCTSNKTLLVEVRKEMEKTWKNLLSLVPLQ